MKKIIVTPAGRQEYLSILVKYLDHYKSEFDEWHLWCNTDNQSDIDYIYKLEKLYSFIKVIPLIESIDKFVNLGGIPYYACTIPYFIKIDTTDVNALYLRLDDDIVFIKKDSIKNIFAYRESNKENFLVYGNIVNNPIMSHIHQNIGALSLNMGKVELDALSKLGLYNPTFVQFCHNNFFEKYYRNKLDKYYFEPFILKNYEYASIQVISWRGSTFKEFDGIIPDGVHEEAYVAEIRPKLIKMPNVIFGDGLFSHFSAAVTRAHTKTTDILFRYKELADEYFLQI